MVSGEAVGQPVGEAADEPVEPGAPAAGAGVPEAVVPAGPPPEPTGDPRVDLVLRRLTELDGTPVSRHVEVFQDVHRRLQDLLASADEPEDAGPPVPRPPLPRRPDPGGVPPRGGATAPGGRP
ncbi:hypothetical protein Arub01_45440 [Actinomadura rubrobrunea]|uniref:Uncharacterized protein n=1 Tax=Actinomadura rubrobrunea TaxID=115335 RepID=A0A9W6PYA1_9ACTN|nr:hypothetical protein [Actinomadura rubrobrunea]GLW66300.1 hypothetical protein Arub01_45440 [Actinomadura rubrobrunea]